MTTLSSRPTPFRLAALYFALFAASVLALLVFIYFSTADFVERQTEATIDAEIARPRRAISRARPRRPGRDHPATAAPRSAAPTARSISSPTRCCIRSPATSTPGREATPMRPGWIELPGRGHRNGVTGAALGARLGVRAARRLPAAGRPRPARCHRLPRAHHQHAGCGRRCSPWRWAWPAASFMTRNMLRRVEAVNRTSERIIHGDLSAARAALRQRRRVRPARRQPQRHARPDRAADERHAPGDGQYRARSAHAAGAAAGAARGHARSRARRARAMPTRCATRSPRPTGCSARSTRS